MRIAIISPNQNAYSETFIQAHKQISAEVLYYYGGVPPKFIEGQGQLAKKQSLIQRGIRYISKRFTDANLNPDQIAFGKSIIKNNIALIIAEYGTTGALILPICKAYNIPLFVFFHGYDASKHTVIDANKEKYIEMFNYAEKIFAVSQAMNKALINLGCPPTKIILNTYGPNDLFLEIQPTYSEPKSFIAIGRFVNKKAPYYTIFAFQKVVEKHPDAKLYYAGEGELLEACQNIVSHLKLENNIYLLGKITPDEYAEYLTRVGGFIQHSITAADGDTEGTPVAVLEASAAGIPVIATKHAGIPDVIINEETGLLVEEHDVEGMAQAILKIIEDPAFGKILGSNGKHRVKSQYSMRRHLKTIEIALGIHHSKD